jgi:GTPase SAR1 family protein
VGVEFYKTEMCLQPRIHATMQVCGVPATSHACCQAMPHTLVFSVLQVWDVGSQVRSLQMAANYLQGSDAVVVVYDVTQHEVRQSAVLC